MFSMMLGVNFIKRVYCVTPKTVVSFGDNLGCHEHVAGRTENIKLGFRD